MTDSEALNILVRGVNWVGDAVMTMPAINALRRAYPQSKISLCLKPSVSAVFEKDPNADEIIMYEERFKGILGKLALANALRKGQFSKAVLLQNAFDAALIAMLAGIPERTGYSRDGRGWLLTRPVPCGREERKLHHINYYLNLLGSYGIEAPYVDPWIYLTIEERMEARAVLSGLKRPVLGINPGAAYGSAKRWLPDRFAGVANLFVRNTGGSAVVFGGANEAGIAREIEKDIHENGLSLAGKISLRQLIALISECDAFVTNDSGPMHIAYAVGTPLAAIFGSTDPALTGPVGPLSRVIKAEAGCSPCFERDCKTADLRCMREITVERVYNELSEVLPDKKAVFFDRDGTLCKDAHYLNNWNDFQIFPDIGSLQALKAEGFALIGVSNQSGIARGFVDEEFTRDVNKLFTDRYGFDDFYYCPHGPREYCSCRKPEPGMLFKARAKYGVDLKKSYVVGDKDLDMQLAKAVGARGILVLTGQHKGSPNADYVAKNLEEVVEILMREGG